MKTISERLFRTVLATLVLLSPLALSAHPKTKTETPTQKASVIAHIPVPGAAASQVILRQQGSKEYLYVQQAGKEGFTIIDVTKPDHPEVVNDVTLDNKGGNEKLEMIGNGVALAETPESSSAKGTQHELSPAKPASDAAAPRTESIRVLDLSDPKNPKTLQTFEGVTNVLAEDARNLIYITNAEGLWILRHNPTQESKKRGLPPCDSESVFAPLADCQ